MNSSIYKKKKKVSSQSLVVFGRTRNANGLTASYRVVSVLGCNLTDASLFFFYSCGLTFHSKGMNTAGLSTVWTEPPGIEFYWLVRFKHVHTISIVGSFWFQLSNVELKSQGTRYIEYSIIKMPIKKDRTLASWNIL